MHGVIEERKEQRAAGQGLVFPGIQIFSHAAFLQDSCAETELLKPHGTLDTVIDF